MPNQSKKKITINIKNILLKLEKKIITKTLKNNTF